jgi:hypothetical protein
MTVPENDSEKETGKKNGRRAAVVIAGGLAAGVILGGAPTAEPAPSIHDQFQSAYVAGSAPTVDSVGVQIVLGE